MDAITGDKRPTSFKHTEHRAVIKFCVRADMTPTDTWKFMNKKKDATKVSRTLVFDWHKRFKEGREDTSDNQRSGRPKSDSGKGQVHSVIMKDRQKSIDDISDTVGLSHGTVHRILTEDLGMSKVCARWVPRLLSADNMQTRIEASENFLRRWRKDGVRFLTRIVTTDETLINFYDPETKRESMMWKRHSSPPPKKAKTVKSMRRIMYIFFMDSHGMLLQHAVPSGQTVNKEYYQKVIRRDLTNAIRKKRPNCELENLIFHQDNAPAHRSQNTLMTIDFLSYERLQHPPYSPDLAPMDFAVFPRLKAELRGRRFDSEDELKFAVRSAVRSFKKEWYATVYHSWVKRHEKCIRCNGEYFEKQ